MTWNKHKSEIKLIILSFFFLVNTIYPQENPVKTINDLINGKWSFHAEIDEFTIDQEIISEPGLDGEIHKTRTYGISNLETHEYGLRAESMIAYDKLQDKILYWSYDVLSGLHTGEVEIKNKDLHFRFSKIHDGKEVIIKDVWAYIDQNHFNVEAYLEKDDGLKFLFKGTATRIIE